MIDPERVLDGLNPKQRDAAQALRGPVVILAGAGSGKTTTITRRIAYQVATRTFSPESILAVAFTRKARTEMRKKLAAYGITDVNVQTIHAAAYQQLRWLGKRPPEVLGEGDKQELMKGVIESVAPQHSGVYRKDLITIVERAKGLGITPTGFEQSARSWPMPLDPDVMARVYGEYERQKDRSGRIDFEDMQRLALEAMHSDPTYSERLHDRVQAITVDEFQDVSRVQVQLIEAWLGGRDEVCVVGDDYQSIYGFRGGSPEFLLGWDRRFPHAKRVVLEANYRSSPEILEFANRLVSSLGGHAKNLRAIMPGGPSPVLRDVPDEPAFVVETVRRLRAEHRTPFEEMAVLVRVNRATAGFQQAFAAAGIPYRVEEGGFLQRPAIAAATRTLRRDGGAVVPAVERAAEAGGLRAGARSEGQHVQDLTLLVELAREFAAAHPEAVVPAFLSDLDQRFTQREDAGEGRGVRLMTYHDAKGLEFDAVFLPRLIDGELPYRSGRAEAPRDEERRLLYVGITRARKHLFVTRTGQASSFWRELEPPRPTVASRLRPMAAPRGGPSARTIDGDVSGSLLEVLTRWRGHLYRRPQFSTFSDSELTAIANSVPTDKDALRAALRSDAKVEKYAVELLDLITRKLAQDGKRGMTNE